MYVRINRAKFDPTHAEKSIEILTTSEDVLTPAIKQMPGLQSYQTGVDRTNGTFIAVSVWDSIEHAHAMNDLPEMKAQAVLLRAQNTSFEPVTIYEIIWQIGMENQ